MKRLLLSILLVSAYFMSECQTSTTYTVSTIADMQAYFGKADRVLVLQDTSDYILCTTCLVDNTTVYSGSGGRKWLKLVNIPPQINEVVNSGPITSVPTVGFTPNTTDIAAWINNVFYQSQPPTASLTGGLTLEYQSAATLTETLNYTAARQSATQPITTIVVAGVNKTFSQPAQGASVSGTQTVSFPANTNITYQNIVTTSDSKTATSSTTFTFSPKRYFGWISDTTGISTFGFDDSKITSLGNELSSSKVKTWNTGNPTGTQYYVYAYYSTAGNLSNLILNGFPSIDAFNVVQRQFTNALGYTGTWIIYWTKNGQTLSSDITAN